MKNEIDTRVQEWLHEPYDTSTRKEVEALLKKGAEAVRDAFYTSLSFGTGGMRGIMGAGTNRMNKYTVQRATQGLANYLRAQFPKESIRVFIGYDSRHHSEEFAQNAARVLAANGITALLCTEIRPTPFVSFGVRRGKCQAGIMITASHNPKEYNGYKVYWSDGAQVVPPHDTGIVKEVEKIRSQNEVHLSPEHHPLIEHVSPAYDLDYLKEIRKLQIDPREDHKVGDALKITYTSLHGTGIKMMPRALKEWGFHNINLVEIQCVPDGNFSTVKSPNPEEKAALALGLAQLEKTRSDILLVTDPDADRLAVACLHKGKAVQLNGNQVASICAEYLCSTLAAQKKLPSNSALVTTIVSTDLIRAIAQQHKITCFEVLTGFKYIGQLIHKWEENNHSYHFLFGAEESYGYLYGTYSRDKDAMISGCLVAEIALLMKAEGRTLVDYLEEIYKKYDYYLEGQKTMAFAPGEAGIQEMKQRMNAMRKSPPQMIAGQKVATLIDYEKDGTGLPKSDVLQFRLADQSKLTVRPSGTEPKLKIYAGVRGKSMEECTKKLQAILSNE